VVHVADSRDLMATKSVSSDAKILLSKPAFCNAAKGITGNANSLNMTLRRKMSAGERGLDIRKSHKRDVGKAVRHRYTVPETIDWCSARLLH
jgi:hypothetical protein